MFNLYKKGTVTSTLKVPNNIQRPDYVGKNFSNAEQNAMSIKTDDEINKIKENGKIVSDLLQKLPEIIAPGVTTDDIDKYCHTFIIENNAYPSPLQYNGFPKSICTSVNNVVVHGIPDTYKLQSGDIVNVDITIYKNGVHVDASKTFFVGKVDDVVKKFVNRVSDAMYKGIDIVRPGITFSAIGTVIENYVSQYNYSVVREYTGHSIGKEFHGSIVVPHYNSFPNYSNIVQENMVFTIEPMINMGKRFIKQLSDGWTEITKDNSLSAQAEHTIVVRKWCRNIDIIL